MWIKGVLLVIFVVIGLTSASVLAAHTLGSGYSGRIETDGFDNGYYLAVWGTGSGINGILYWVGNNTMAKNLSPIVTSGRTVNKLSLASKRGFHIPEWRKRVFYSMENQKRTLRNDTQLRRKRSKRIDSNLHLKHSEQKHAGGWIR